MDMTRRMAATLIAALGCIAGLAGGAPRALAGAPEVAIAVDRVHRSDPSDGAQAELAEILDKLLPSRLERALGEMLKSYAWVERVRLPDDRQEAREMLGRAFRYLMVPTVEPGTRANPVRLDLYDLGLGEDDRGDLPLPVNELEVFSIGADFGEIEAKVDALAMRMARRIAAGRTTPVGVQPAGKITQSVLVWCVLPYSPEDARATLLGRQLTLQLPYFLSERMAERGYGVAGISPHEFYSECTLTQIRQQGERASRGFERYDYIASGQVFPVKGDAYELNLLLDARDTTFAVPLPPIELAAELDDAAFAEISERLVRALESLAAK